MILWSMVVLLGTPFLFAGGLTIAWLSGWKTLLLVSFLVFLLGVVVSQILAMAGLYYCLAAPSRRGAKALAIAAFVLAIVALVLSLVGDGLHYAAGSFESGRSRSSVANQFGFAGHMFALICDLVFLFFLLALAGCIDSKKLANSAVNLIFFWFLSVAGLVGLVVMIAMAPASKLPIKFGPVNVRPEKIGLEGVTSGVLVFGCAEIVIGLSFLVFLIMVLSSARTNVILYIRKLRNQV